MRVFKNKTFHRWAKEESLKDLALAEAVDEMARGLYEASLGGHIFKKRIPMGNRGKRGGARTIIAFKADDRAFFIYGYSKNERENITDKEEEALKSLAKIYFNYEEKHIIHAIKHGELIEVAYEKINS